jgi:antitoxin FitA
MSQTKPVLGSISPLSGPPTQQFPCDTSDAIIDSMAQLIVRNLDEEIVTRLRQRAAKHRRSTEAEHREILREVLLPPRSRSSLKEHLLAMPDAGTDRDFERRPDRPRKRVTL